MCVCDRASVFVLGVVFIPNQCLHTVGSIALVEVVAWLVLEAAALWHCVVLSMSVYAHYCVFLAE